MREVQNKWNTLKMNDDIWAKLIYFEQNRRLAKAYVSAPVLTIDGSTNGLDGFRIGLSGIDNSYRGLDSIACLRSIGQGVKLKIDSQGNILMRRIGPPANASKSSASSGATSNFEQCSVWVKDWPSISPTSGQSTSASLSSSSMSSSTNLSSSSDLSSSSSLAGPSADNWHMKQIDQMDVSYKIFDMNKFRQQLERRRHLNGNNNNNNSLTMDWRQCVSIISFVRTKFNEPANSKGSPQKTILRDPCWLMLINIIAIDMLKSSIREATGATKSAAAATTNMNPLQIPKPDYLSPLELNNIPHRPKLSSRQPPIRQTILDYEPFSEPGATSQQAKQQLRASSSIASLYSPNQQQQPTYRSSQLDLDRLTRLNNIRYGANRFLAGSRPHSISTQHLGYPNDGTNNNVIYTTFTGKYTNNQTSNHKRVSAAYLADYSSTSDYNSTSKSSSYARNKPPQKESLENSPTSYHNNQLYPQERQATNRWPQVRPYELSSRSKSQSLSNFDWSHHQRQSREQPLKKSLDLRSMKTSSIKMNFDDDDNDNDDHQNDYNEAENDHDELEVDGGEQGRADRQVSAGIVSRMADRFGKEPLLKTNSSSGRRPMVPMKKQASNWSSRPGRRDARLEQTSQEAPRPTKQSKASEPDVINEEEGEQLDLDGVDQNGHSNQDSDNKTQTKLGKLKVSRSSIASTHSSSSSGCPENDYFISNSSSSMSSSTGSQECELFSQPASSSGIICSGNTSDEYEMDARNKKQQVSSNGTQNHQFNSKTSDSDGLPNKTTSKSKKEIEQANSQEDNVDKNKKQSVQSDKKEPQLRHQKLTPSNGRSKQHIRSISRNRCRNVKTVDLDGEHTDDIICGHHYSNQQSCDCDELATGGKERLAASDDANACDCCCDCFVDIYQTPPPIDANVQVDRCDCGHVEPSDNQFQDDSHESIYERLPHPGKLAYAGNRGKNSRRSIDKNDLVRSLERSALSMANVNEEDVEYDHIQTIPFSTSSSHPLQPPVSEDPKKSSHKDSKSSWLERRNYIKLFPKFMFSSRSSFSSRSPPGQQANNTNKQSRPTGKSSTLDISNSSIKFRRTRSSQNLKVTG